MEIFGIWRFNRGVLTIGSNSIVASDDANEIKIGYSVSDIYYSINKYGKDVVIVSVEMDNGYTSRIEVERRISIPYSTKTLKYNIEGAYIAFMKSLKAAYVYKEVNTLDIDEAIDIYVNKLQVKSLKELLKVVNRGKALYSIVNLLGIDPQNMKQYIKVKPVWKFSKNYSIANDKELQWCA